MKPSKPYCLQKDLNCLGFKKQEAEKTILHGNLVEPVDCFLDQNMLRESLSSLGSVPTRRLMVRRHRFIKHSQSEHSVVLSCSWAGSGKRLARANSIYIDILSDTSHMLTISLSHR